MTAPNLVETEVGVPAVMATTRPFDWSVRREVWENRSIYLAPLIVTAVVLFGTFISVISMPHRLRSTPDPAKQQPMIVAPVRMAPAPIMLSTFLVGFFYSLDALYGERRDRSILFWKSLPVSDRTVVLSKLAIPTVVLPLIAFILGFSAQILVVLLTTMVLIGSGHSAALLWRNYSLFEDPAVQFYGLTVHALWFAPIYGWLLLISGWARRAPFLWAVLPFFAIGIFERIVLGTSRFGTFLQNRFTGAMAVAFTMKEKHPDVPLTPLRFLTTPALWIGLAFAAACVIAAARIRRYREPI